MHDFTMFTFGAVCIFLVSCVDSSSFVDKTMLLKTQCRAKCLNEFYRPQTTPNCEDNPDCYMCWDTCHLFFENFEVWGPMCDDEQICLRYAGCRQSCDFYSTRDAIQTRSIDEPNTLHAFADGFRSSFVSERDSIRFEWSPPQISFSGPFIYLLLLQEPLGSSWEVIEQTFYHNATVRRGFLKSASRIRLMAFDGSGPVAHFERSATQLNVDGESMHLDDTAPLRSNVTALGWRPTLLTLRYSVTQHGGVEALLMWSSPPVRATAFKYELVWKIMDASMDVTGRMYTSGVSATIPVWGASVYTVHLQAYPMDSGHVIAKSETIVVDTRDADVTPQCSECVPFNSVIIGGITIIVVMLLLFILVVLIIKIFQRNPEDKQASPPSKQKSLQRRTAPVNVSLSPGNDCGEDKLTTKSVGPVSPMGQSREDLLNDTSPEGNYFVFDTSRKLSLKRKFSRGYPV